MKVLERVATARERARAETWERVAPLLTPHRRAELDSLLAVDPVLGRTRLTGLEAGPVSATPAAVKDELEKLASCAGWTPTRSTCRCCLLSGGGSWPGSDAGSRPSTSRGATTATGTRCC